MRQLEEACGEDGGHGKEGTDMRDIWMIEKVGLERRSKVKRVSETVAT